MANAKKSTLDTPESQADVTYIKVMTAEINFESGEIRGTYCRCTAGDVVVGSERYSFTCPGTNLETIENEILTEADTASAIPSGTIGAV